MLKWIFKLFSVLPLWLLHALGALLGVLVYVLASGYRRKMLEHSLQVFGNNHAERKRAVLRSIIHGLLSEMKHFVRQR